MSFSIRRVLGLGVIAGLAGACSSQAAVQAKFHLPVQAHWGVATLAPGDYNIRVTDLSSGLRQVVLEGNGRTVYAMPTAVDPERNNAHSTIELVEMNGNYFVKQFRSESSGKTYSFKVPKPASPVDREKSVFVSK